jgi:phage terminase large subunit-like protein
VNPLGGKVARAEAAAVMFRQGQVFLPRHSPWLGEYVGQLLSFPSGTFDDLVDETSQALNFCAGTGPMRVTTATYGHGLPQQQPEAPTRRRSAIPGFR